MSEASLEIRAEADGMVRLRVDRPGVAAVSVTRDPIDLIADIAEVAGLNVYFKNEADEDELAGGVA